MLCFVVLCLVLLCAVFGCLSFLYVVSFVFDGGVLKTRLTVCRFSVVVVVPLL